MNLEEVVVIALALVALAWFLRRGFEEKRVETVSPQAREQEQRVFTMTQTH